MAGGFFGVSEGGWEGMVGDVGGIVGVVGVGLFGISLGGFCVGDFGTSCSNQVPGIKAIGRSQVAVRVTPCPKRDYISELIE